MSKVEFSQGELWDMANTVASRDPMDDWKETCERWYHSKVAMIQRLASESRVLVQRKIVESITVRCGGGDGFPQGEEDSLNVIADMDQKVGKAIAGYRQVANARIFLGIVQYQLLESSHKSKV